MLLSTMCRHIIRPSVGYLLATAMHGSTVSSLDAVDGITSNATAQSKNRFVLILSFCTAARCHAPLPAQGEGRQIPISQTTTALQF
jgi:hypothetical protein